MDEVKVGRRFFLKSGGTAAAAVGAVVIPIHAANAAGLRPPSIQHSRRCQRARRGCRHLSASSVWRRETQCGNLCGMAAWLPDLGALNLPHTSL